RSARPSLARCAGSRRRPASPWPTGSRSGTGCRKRRRSLASAGAGGRATRRLIAPLVALVVAGGAGEAMAQAPSPPVSAQVKVVVEFRGQALQHREGVQGGAVVVVPRSGNVRGRGGLGAEDTTTRTTRSTGLFVVAADGAVGTILVAQDVPVPHLAYFYDQAVGAGYVVAGTAWVRAGAGLAVRPV